MKIIIPGIPVPQARMKHSRRGNFVTTYDPKAKEKTEIRKVLEVFRLTQELSYPRVSFLFHMPIPSGIPKRDRALYESGTLKHDKKPDVDNLVKLYLDCTDGIVLHGDQKVSLGPCQKVYHPEPKTIMWIHETQRTLSFLEKDFAFLDALEHETPYSYGQGYLSDFDNLLKITREQYLHNWRQDGTFPPLGTLASAHLLTEGEDMASQKN